MDKDKAHACHVQPKSRAQDNLAQQKDYEPCVHCTRCANMPPSIQVALSSCMGVRHVSACGGQWVTKAGGDTMTPKSVGRLPRCRLAGTHRLKCAFRPAGAHTQPIEREMRIATRPFGRQEPMVRLPPLPSRARNPSNGRRCRPCTSARRPRAPGKREKGPAACGIRSRSRRARGAEKRSWRQRPICLASRHPSWALRPTQAPWAPANFGGGAYIDGGANAHDPATAAKSGR